MIFTHPLPKAGSTKLSAMIGIRRLASGRSTNLPIRWVKRGSSGWTASAPSPSIVSGRVVAIQPDGKIVVAGTSFTGTSYRFALARYNDDGSLDTSFDGDGRVVTDFGTNGELARSVALQTDGKIVAAGQSGPGTAYATVHRLAIGSAYRGKGIAGLAFALVEELCRERGVPSIRVDTDAGNQAMQHILEKSGFTYCGTITFDNSEKIAFEKLLG